MTKRDKIAATLREGFPEALAGCFLARFGIPVSTSWDIFTGNLITTRDDDEPMDATHAIFLDGFCAAWVEATARAVS